MFLGRSPRARGSPQRCWPGRAWRRSIPASAGEPARARGSLAERPRVWHCEGSIPTIAAQASTSDPALWCSREHNTGAPLTAGGRRVVDVLVPAHIERRRFPGDGVGRCARLARLARLARRRRARGRRCCRGARRCAPVLEVHLELPPLVEIGGSISPVVFGRSLAGAPRRIRERAAGCHRGADHSSPGCRAESNRTTHDRWRVLQPATRRGHARPQPAPAFVETSRDEEISSRRDLSRRDRIETLASAPEPLWGGDQPQKGFAQSAQ